MNLCLLFRYVLFDNTTSRFAYFYVRVCAYAIRNCYFFDSFFLFPFYVQRRSVLDLMYLQIFVLCLISCKQTIPPQ